MSDRVTVNEVGPRDGLQSQSRILPVAERLQLIRALESAGISRIEAGSFVSPKAVPAMADTDLLLQSLDGAGAANYSFLIPNMKGYELAREAGAESVTMVVYASETMARRNVRMGMDDAERAAWKIIDLARADGIEVIVIVAVSFGCPFEGAVDAAIVRDIAARFVAAGIHRLVLADTIGAADPAQVGALLASWPGIMDPAFSAAISTTPGQWPWPMSMPLCRRASAGSTVPSAVSAAVLSRPAPAAMWRRRTWR